MTDAGCWPKFIWTHWGTLVYCDEQGNLRHGDLKQVPRNVFVFENPVVILSKQHRQAVELVTGEGRTAGIRYGGLLYCAEPDGAFLCNRTVGGSWEQVVLLAEDEVEILSALQANDWVLRDATIIAASDIQFDEGFQINFGPMRIDLPQPGSLTVAERAGDHVAAVNFVHGGWQVATARRFRPLIYFAVFGPDHIFDMLRLCLTSIVKNGDYTGHVFVLSDRERESIELYIPQALVDRTFFSFRHVTDHASMMMERFDMSDLPIDDFQPVLCLDADMICDAPLMPLLAHCNTATKFFGSAEYGGVAMTEMSEEVGNWFGRFLFEAAGQNFAQVRGLNGGAIAVPNKPSAIPIIDAVAMAFVNSREKYPDFRGMGEQPILNYVLQSLSVIDASALNKFIQFRNECRGGQERRGLMHFNYGPGWNKMQDMQNYFDYLGRLGFSHNMDTTSSASISQTGEVQWLIDHQGEDYLIFLERLHRLLAPRSYLEIGSRTGDSLALATCSSIAVDPVFKLKPIFLGQKKICALYAMKSDDYFTTQSPSAVVGEIIDFAFLDGLHLAEFLLRDFTNTEKYCAKNSVIAIHDCIPLHSAMTARDEAEAIAKSTPKHPGWWTGDVWLTIEALKKYRPDLKIMAFDAPPTGIILITNLNPQSNILAENYNEIEKKFYEKALDKARYMSYIHSLNIQSTHSLKTPDDIANYLAY